MDEFEVRPVAEGEERAVFEMLSRSLHSAPVTEERWEQVRRSFPAERKFGAFVAGEPIGMATSFATELAVPGGKQLATAAVDGIGVLPDHTRRGVITAIIAEQFRDCVRRGDLLATLHASEATIYHRFGYGVGTRLKQVLVRKNGTGMHPAAPRGGEVRLLSGDAALARIPGLYHRIAPNRPGMITRPPVWWPAYHDRRVGPSHEHEVAVHSGPDGEDGFVVYRPVELRTFEEPMLGAALEVRDLHAGNPAALAGLWRYLLKVDLVSEVRAERPPDEPVDQLLADSRSCEVRALRDHTWLRLLDVPAALSARTYRQAEPVVLEVTDPLLTENSGCYRITPDGASRTDEPAQLRLEMPELAMIYLGEWAPSTLAQVGRIGAPDASALPAADELFRTTVRPWCGTYF
jgi:predicted acetyltransferase